MDMADDDNEIMRLLKEKKIQSGQIEQVNYCVCNIK